MFKKLAMFVGVGAAGLSLLVTKAVHAAADTDLVATYASGTAYMTDNKGASLGWIAGVFGFVLIVTIVTASFARARRNVGGAIGGGKRRR